jgi:hypothetical protein
MFRVQRVHIADERFNSVNPGQAESFDYLYGVDSCLLFYSDGPVATKNSLSLAKTIAWNGEGTGVSVPFFGVESKYDDDSKSYLVRCSAYWDVKTVAIQAGGAFYDVLS